MSNYELTPAEKQTLESLKEKKWEVLGFQVLEKDSGSDQAHFVWCDCSTLTGHWYSDEAAYALMEHRGLKELGEKWDEKSSWFLLNRLSRYMNSFEIKDMLAAILVAMEDKEDG